MEQASAAPLSGALSVVKIFLTEEKEEVGTDGRRALSRLSRDFLPLSLRAAICSVSRVSNDDSEQRLRFQKPFLLPFGPTDPTVVTEEEQQES